jgi:hypothetical protein
VLENVKMRRNILAAVDTAEALVGIALARAVPALQDEFVCQLKRGLFCLAKGCCCKHRATAGAAACIRDGIKEHLSEEANVLTQRTDGEKTRQPS